MAEVNGMTPAKIVSEIERLSDKWYKGVLDTAYDLDTIRSVGTHGLRGSGDYVNLPEDLTGVAGALEVLYTGGRYIQRITTWEQYPRIYTRIDNGASWYSWKFSGGGKEAEDGDSVAGLKTAAVTLTAGSLLDGAAGRYRVLAHVTAPVTRWRVHFESRRQVFSTTSNFTLGAVSVGRHTGNGAITGITSLKTGSTNVSGSSEWVSRWITHDLSQETLIDFTASGSNLFSYQAGSYQLNGTVWQVSKNVPLAVWIEVETYAETPVVAMIGDSTGAGQGADRAVHESALHIASRKHGFIPMNYSYPGSSMASMNNPDHHIYKRWAGLAKPDSVIIQSGSNDIHAGTSTSELKTRFEGIASLAHGISPVVIGSTVKSRYPTSGDHVTSLTAHNSYIKTQPAGIRDYLDFYQAVSPSGTVASADAADAAHLSTSGHQKLATAFDAVAVSRPAAIDTRDAKPGQVPRWTGTGFRWSWLDQHTNLYDNTY